MTRGRPEKPIDWKKVDALLEAGCHGTEICPHFDLSPDRFYDRVQEKYGINFTVYAQEKKQKGDSSLRDAQFKKALDGDNSMLIWLGKNRLGQKESHEDKQSPKQEDLDLKKKYYASQYEIQILKERLNAFESKTSPELQSSDSSL